MGYRVSNFIILPLLFVMMGCQTTGDTSAGFSSTLSATQMRQLDSRKFETDDEVLVLTSIIGLLQDLGYKLDETDKTAGLVSGSKGSKGEFGYSGSDIRVTVTTTPLKGGYVRVRTTFQDISVGSDARYYRAQPVTDPVIFRKFYDKLAQSLFLEAHSL